MRPVVRGPAPANATEWTHYGDASRPLAWRIGWYCSYCETPIPIGIAVEHILPKRDHPQLELEWSNFLLACGICNPTKGDATYDLAGHLWPDRDNTARAFVYLDSGLIEVASDLPADVDVLADATLQMVGLDRSPETDGVSADLRWGGRLNTWNIASRQATSLANNDTPALRDCIIELAKQSGYWSVWMTVFADDREIRKRLIAEFRGTANNCFNADAETITTQRPGGKL